MELFEAVLNRHEGLFLAHFADIKSLYAYFFPTSKVYFLNTPRAVFRVH
jgi:hypothetical protein